MRRLAIFISIFMWGFFPSKVLAQTADPQVINFTNQTLHIITLIAASAVVFFVIKAGYMYMTSSGQPEVLMEAKKTLKNALIGLSLILAANVVVTVFRQSLNETTSSSSNTPIEITNIEALEPRDGLTQVLIDAVGGFIQNLIESSTAPIVDGVITYLTNTPTLLDNQVIRNFWLISVGIVDVLFVLVVSLLGLQMMSASTFGFEEVELRQLLPRLGLAFLAANVSLFLVDYVILACNALTSAVLNSTGGINQAFISNLSSPIGILSGSTPLIILIFLVLFLIVSIVLLLMYISRLIMIALGAVLSPFIFLLWALPKFSDMAYISIKTYVVTVFIVFVHVVIIQLAASFLTLPEHNQNSLMAIAVAIGLFFTLLKTPSLMMQMVMYTSRNGTFKKLGNQIINVISTDNSSSVTRAQAASTAAKVPRKVVKI